MGLVVSLVVKAAERTALAFVHNAPYLVASILVAALLELYVDARKVAEFLARFRAAGVLAATAAAVGTPFCSCGTMAVVLGMMATTMPWAPIVAFMVASPLSSPADLVYSAGLFGWPFAIAFFAASILLGLAAGGIASFAEARGWLAGQARLALPRVAGEPSAGAAASGCGCAAAAAEPTAGASGCGCDGGTVSQRVGAVAAERSAFAWRPLLVRTWRVGRRLIAMFAGFAFLGYLLNGLIPAGWVSGLFGGGRVYSVPLAATLGLPLYVNAEASLPLVRALLESGMSPGAAMAFLITGAGTSVGALAGALTIARWRVVGLVVGVLWAGAIVCGGTYELLRAVLAL